MMHCMVNRRFAPARRRTSLNNVQKDCNSRTGSLQNHVERSTSLRETFGRLPQVLCQEGSPFQQLSFCERILPSQDSSGRPENTSQHLAEFAHMSIDDNSCCGQEAGYQSIAAGTPGSVHNEEQFSAGSVGPIQRLCLWSANRPSPYIRPSNGVRGSSSRQAQGYGDTAVNAVKPREGSSCSTDGCLSWFSLDYGESITASCLTKVGSQVGEKEAAVWQGFAPLQRVLVVAVAAAAAASAKEKNLTEICRLQQEVDSKDQSLTLLRGELRELWDKVLFDTTSTAPKTEGVTHNSRLTGDCSTNRNLVLGDAASQPKAANERSGRTKRQGSRGWDNPLFGDITLDVEDPTEWLSVHSSVTSLDSFYGSPQRFPTHACRMLYQEMGEDDSKMWQGTHKDVNEVRAKSGMEANATRARCASIILGIRKDIRVFLEREAFAVLGAFAEVIDMATRLQVHGETSNFSLLVAVSPTEEALALVALQRSIERATELVASLQTAVLHMYNTVGPQSLAALEISPTEFEKCLQMVKDGGRPVRPSEASISAWRQWLSLETQEPQEATREDLFKPQILVVPNNANRLTRSGLPQASDWNMSGTDVASALREAVSKAVDTLTTPAPGLSACSAESVAEQLLSELETAACKVAGMEAQLKSIQMYVQTTEKQRQEADAKLEEALHINKKTQAKASFDVMELTRELKLKELEVDDLQRSRTADQALLAEKSAEVQKLKDESKRRSAAFESISATSQAANDANEKKLAALEDICRRKDISIAGLKQEIAALEMKVSELKLRSPQHVRKASNLPDDTTARSLRSSLESSFEALAIGDISVCSTPKRRESRRKPSSPPALPEAVAKMPSQCILTESAGTLNRNQLPVREYSRGKDPRGGDVGNNVSLTVEGNRSKTGMVMHTLDHGESRVSGPYLFSDENYLSLIERNTPRFQVANPGTVAPHTTPTNPAQRRADKESEQRSSLSKAIKDSADKRRRWL